MSSPTLVIADYPIGFASGFGETLFNLFRGFETHSLWSAHPHHNRPALGKERGQSLALPSPRRPRKLPSQLNLPYYPLLKAQQLMALKQSVQSLSRLIKEHSIRNVLVIPVSPWILSVASSILRKNKDLNVVLLIMDDWQGHHESYGLPYSSRRRRLLREMVNRANTRFAISREMASHYENVFGKDWLVAHNGVELASINSQEFNGVGRNRILLAGDVNVFRYDAVMAFSKAIDRYNNISTKSIEFSILGDIASEYSRTLSRLRGISLKGRQSHSECLDAMRSADLLYLPLAFSDKARRISLYSLPTKLPEYLATGKPICFHAPKESALFQVAERFDLSPRLDSIEEAALDGFLAQWVREDSVGWNSFAGARLALSQEFDIEQLAARFQQAFV